MGTNMANNGQYGRSWRSAVRAGNAHDRRTLRRLAHGENNHAASPHWHADRWNSP